MSITIHSGFRAARGPLRPAGPRTLAFRPAVRAWADVAFTTHLAARRAFVVDAGDDTGQGPVA